MALIAEALPRTPFRQNMRDLTEYTLDINPVYQAGLVTERVSGESRASRDVSNITYYWEVQEVATWPRQPST